MLDDETDLGGGSGAVGPMFPTYDGNGNVTRVYSTNFVQTNQTERVAEYRYGPFGEHRGQSGRMASKMPFRWSTKFADNETGLSYYGYRYYSASMGRWINRDPIGERGGTNLLGFVDNLPTSDVDPLGLWRFVPDVGVFSGSFGPTSVATLGSSFNLVFLPDRSYFLCADCTSVGFVQIYRAEYVTAQRIVQNEVDFSGNWTLDADPGPFYMYAEEKNPKKGVPSSMHDTPMLGINWLMRRLPYYLFMEFETCAVCSGGTARGEVYGCVRWSHLFTGGQAVVDTYWLRRFVSRSQLIEWSDQRTEQFHEWKRPPWVARQFPDDIVTRSVGGSAGSTLTFSFHDGLNPTSNMSAVLGRFFP